MFELSLMCPQDRVETVADALDALEALSVSVEDADAQTDAEQALFGEPGMEPEQIGWRHSTIKALFDERDTGEACGHAVAGAGLLRRLRGDRASLRWPSRTGSA